MTQTLRLLRVAGLGLAAAAVSPGPGMDARAQGLPTAAENLTPGDIDSEHLFGFAEGSDIGVPGEAEFEWETTGRQGRRFGRFLAVESGLSLKVPLTADLRLAPGLTFEAHDVGAPGTPSRTTGGVNGGFLETRLRLMDRRTGPFGLTLGVAPGYGSVEADSGAPARSFGTKVALLADRELIPGTLVVAVNLSFNLAATRLGPLEARVHGSGIEAAAALAYRLRPGVFVGGEARYARAYGGLTLDRLAGDAVYLGPTIYATLSPHAWVSLTVSAQVAGRGTGEPGALNLTSFDRRQARLRIGYSF